MMMQTMDELLYRELQMLYSIENQLIVGLPMMIDQAHSRELRQGLSDHLETTKEQAARIEEIAQQLDLRLSGMTDLGMQSILEEGQALIQQISDPDLRDTAIMGAIGKVEHYEMAGYQSAATLAKKLGMDEAASMLNETMNEEKTAANKIHMLATGSVVAKTMEQMKAAVKQI